MVSSRSRPGSMPAAAGVSGACRVMIFLLLRDGAAASAELGDELARAAGTGLAFGSRRTGVGGEDLDVVKSAAAGAGAAVRDGGEHLAAESGLEEINVDAGGNGDGVFLAGCRVDGVARQGEGSVAEGEDHSAVGHAEAVEHFLPERHPDGGVAVAEGEDLDSHPLGGVVVFQDGVGSPGKCSFSHASLPPALFTECSLGNPMRGSGVKGRRPAGGPSRPVARPVFRTKPGTRRRPRRAARCLGKQLGWKARRRHAPSAADFREMAPHGSFRAWTPPSSAISRAGSARIGGTGTKSKGRTMATGIYVSATTPGSGKSLVALGLADTLHRHADRIGFFKPVVHGRADADPMVALMKSRFDLDDDRCRSGLTFAEVRGLLAEGNREEIDSRCVEIFAEMSRHCDVVIIEGTDLTGQDAAVEFDLNARLANNLAAPMVAVVGAKGRTVAETADAVEVARKELAAEHCSLLAIMVNRADPEDVDGIVAAVKPGASGRPVYVFPELEDIARPTTGEVAAALGIGQVAGLPDLERDVHSVKVAAMNVANFLHVLDDGALVIVPGDRADVLVACL